MRIVWAAVILVFAALLLVLAPFTLGFTAFLDYPDYNLLFWLRPIFGPRISVFRLDSRAARENRVRNKSKKVGKSDVESCAGEGDRRGAFPREAEKPVAALGERAGILHRVREILDLAIRIARLLRVERFELRGQFGTGDAYSTALFCGLISAAVGAAIGTAGNAGVKFARRPRVGISPYYGERLVARMSVRLETTTSLAKTIPVLVLALRARFGVSRRRPVSPG